MKKTTIQSRNEDLVSFASDYFVQFPTLTFISGKIFLKSLLSIFTTIDGFLTLSLHLLLILRYSHRHTFSLSFASIVEAILTKSLSGAAFMMASLQRRCSVGAYDRLWRLTDDVCVIFLWRCAFLPISWMP